MTRPSRPALLLAVLTCLLPFPSSSAFAYSKSAGLMNLSSDGSLIACSNRDSGTVTIVSLPGLKVQHEISVGHHPEGVAWLGSTKQLACCVYGDDKVVLVDAETGKITKSIDVFDEPYGIVSSSDGKTLYVTLEYPGQVVAVSAESGDVQATWKRGTCHEASRSVRTTAFCS